MTRETLIKLIDYGYLNVDHDPVSDEYVREFFLELPIGYMFVKKKLSNDILTEFKENIIHIVGLHMFENLYSILDNLEKYDLDSFDMFTKKSDKGYKEDTYTLGINTQNYCFNLTFRRNGKTAFMSAHLKTRKVNYLPTTDIFLDNQIIISINQFLFDNIK